jgi:LysR family transcriptional activator of mexEF-oprN operon
VLSTPHFLVVPHLLLETSLIATLHGRAVQWFGAAFGLTRSPVPIEVSGFEESMVWHEVVDRDPAQLWLRDTILSTAQTL